jgi:regulatory protein
MEISSVERSKKDKKRFVIYIDGQYSFSISEEDYLRLNIYEKRVLTGAELEDIKKNILFRDAKASAVKYVTFKLRSEGELARKLRSEGYSDDIVQMVVEDVRSLGYINDKLYAQKYIYDRNKLKPRSKKMLKLELKSRGIPDEIIDEALDGWKIDERDVVEGLIKKRFGKYDMSDEKTDKRIYAFLCHRGFGADIIREVLERIGSEPG